LAELPGKYAPRSGCLLIAMIDGVAGGAVAFRRLEDEASEAKRLYVSVDFLCRGVARLLMNRLIEEARAAGYLRIAGDTMPDMATALAMYDRMGFCRIGSYPGRPGKHSRRDLYRIHTLVLFSPDRGC
jgi:putative acetyltransferase